MTTEKHDALSGASRLTDVLGVSKNEDGIDFFLNDTQRFWLIGNHKFSVASGCIKFAIMLPCFFIGPLACFANEEPKLANSGSMSNEGFLQKPGNIRPVWIIAAVVPGGSDLAQGQRESAVQFDASRAARGQRSDEASREITNNATSQDATKAGDNANNIWDALCRHVYSIVFVIGIVPAWFAGWFLADYAYRVWKTLTNERDFPVPRKRQ